MLRSKIWFKPRHSATPELTYSCCNCKLFKLTFSSRLICRESFNRAVSKKIPMIIPPEKINKVNKKASRYLPVLIVLSISLQPERLLFKSYDHLFLFLAKNKAAI